MKVLNFSLLRLSTYLAEVHKFSLKGHLCSMHIKKMSWKMDMKRVSREQHMGS